MRKVVSWESIFEILRYRNFNDEDEEKDADFSLDFIRNVAEKFYQREQKYEDLAAFHQAQRRAKYHRRTKARKELATLPNRSSAICRTGATRFAAPTSRRVGGRAFGRGPACSGGPNHAQRGSPVLSTPECSPERCAA